MNKISAYNEFENSQTTESLIMDNLSLVKAIAQHIYCRLPEHIQLDDLIQCGIIGLVEAAHRYQSQQGVSFSTFAGHRIRGAIIDELRKNDDLPRSLQMESKRLQKAIRFIEQNEGRAAHDNEIAAAMNLSMDEYETLLQALNVHYTLSTDEIELIDEEHIDAEQPLQWSVKAEAKTILAEQLARLPEKEKLVMALYYNEDLNFKQIGDVLEVSESRVSQLHGQAMTRLQARVKNTLHLMDEHM